MKSLLNRRSTTVKTAFPLFQHMPCSRTSRCRHHVNSIHQHFLEGFLKTYVGSLNAKGYMGDFLSFSLGLFSQNSERTVIAQFLPCWPIVLWFLEKVTMCIPASLQLIHRCVQKADVTTFTYAPTESAHPANIKNTTSCYYFMRSCLKRSIHPTVMAFACKRQTWQENVEKTQSEFKCWGCLWTTTVFLSRVISANY